MNREVKENPNQKKEYVAPQLTVYGNVEDITLGGTTGGSLDVDFSVGTPRGSLTFS